MAWLKVSSTSGALSPHMVGPVHWLPVTSECTHPPALLRDSHSAHPHPYCCWSVPHSSPCTHSRGLIALTGEVPAFPLSPGFILFVTGVTEWPLQSHACWFTTYSPMAPSSRGDGQCNQSACSSSLSHSSSGG